MLLRCNGPWERERVRGGCHCGNNAQKVLVVYLGDSARNHRK